MRCGEIRTTGDGAVLSLAIDEGMAGQVPAGSTGRLLPKTLFGEKFVSLVTPQGAGRPVAEGDVLAQDRSVAGIETEKVLDDALPLLQALQPDDLSRTLNALSGALRGRGERIGENAELVDRYLARLNPALPDLQQNLRGVADLADTYDDVAPDLLAVLDDLSFSSRSLVDQEQPARPLPRPRPRRSPRTFDEVLRENETRLVRLAADSRPVLRRLRATSRPEYACLARGLADADQEVGAHLRRPAARAAHHPRDDQGPGRASRPATSRSTATRRGPTCSGLPGVATATRRWPLPALPRGATTATATGTSTAPRACRPVRAPVRAAAAQAQSQHDLLALVTSPVLGVPAEQVGRPRRPAVRADGPRHRGRPRRLSRGRTTRTALCGGLSPACPLCLTRTERHRCHSSVVQLLGGLVDPAAGTVSAAPSPPASGAPADGLTEREREVLAFERQWWKYAGAKEQAVRDLFDMSATRYYQVLNALIDRPEALVADPMLVKRLRRLRATRQRTRSARRLGMDA